MSSTIPYRLGTFNTCLSICPYYRYLRVGSVGCMNCKYHTNKDKINKTVTCIKDKEVPSNG